MYFIISISFFAFIVISAGTHRLYMSVQLVCWMVQFLPVSHVRLDLVHCTSVYKVAPSNLLGSIGIIVGLGTFMRKAACVWSRDINFVADVWFRLWFSLILQTLRNFYLTSWKKEFYLINQKMLRNICSNKWTVVRHSLHLKIDIQPVASILILWVLYVLMEFFTSPSSSDNNELILTVH